MESQNYIKIDSLQLEELKRQKKFLFSVVTAVYNCEEYVAEAIDSVIAQDIGFEKNIQLILVDDGSSDNSYSICQQYLNKYPNNIVLIHNENHGVSYTRNCGTKYAFGKYINYMDADDRFSASAFNKVYNFFKKYESQTDVVTIKNELFGMKTGDSWYNAKFKNGTQLLNLWTTPQVYLNSTNCSFFHKRIINQGYVTTNS